MRPESKELITDLREHGHLTKTDESSLLDVQHLTDLVDHAVVRAYNDGYYCGMTHAAEAVAMEIDDVNSWQPSRDPAALPVKAKKFALDHLGRAMGNIERFRQRRQRYLARSLKRQEEQNA